jgi:hypothetical protein
VSGLLIGCIGPTIAYHSGPGRTGDPDLHTTTTTTTTAAAAVDGER